MATIIDTVIWKGVWDTSQADFEGFQRKVKGAQSKTKRSFDAFNREVGKGLTTTAGLLWDFADSAVDSLSEFEEAFVGVAKRTGLEGSFDDLNSELGKLARNIQDVSLDDLKGQFSPQEFAGVVAASKAISVANETVLDFSTGIAQTTRALELNAEKGAIEIGKILNAFQLDKTSEQVLKLGSAMNEIVDGTVIKNANELINTMGRITGSSKTFQLSVEQMIGISGALRTLVPGRVEKTTTAWNKMVNAIIKDSDSFRDALNLDDAFSELVTSNPEEAILDVVEAMGKLGETKGQKVLLDTLESLLGAGDGVTALATNIAGAQDVFEESISRAKEASEANVSALSEFEKVSSTIDARNKQLASQWETMQQRAAILFLPMVESVQTHGIAAMDEMLNNGEVFLNEFATAINQSLGGLEIIPESIGSAYDGFFRDMQGNYDELKEHTASVALEMIAQLTGIPAETVEAFRTGFTEIKATISEVLGFMQEEIEDKQGKNVEALSTQTEKLAEAQAKAAESATVYKQRLFDLERSYQILDQGSDALVDDFTEIEDGLQSAIKAGVAPSQELIEQFQAMQTAIHNVGVEAYGNSTFPDMTAAMQESQAQALELTGEMASMEAEIAKLGDTYADTQKEISNLQNANRDLESQMIRLETAASSASKFRKKQINEEISGLKLQRKENLILIKNLTNRGKAEKKAISEANKEYKELEESYKEQEKSIASMEKAIAKAEKEYLSFFRSIDQETQDWLFDQENMVEILEDLGKEVGEAEQAILEQARAERKAELQTEAFAIELEKLAQTSGTTVASFDDLKGAVSGIGDIFGVELGGLTDTLGGVFEGFGGDLSNIGNLGGIFGDIAGGLAGLAGPIGLLQQGMGLNEGLFKLFGMENDLTKFGLIPGLVGEAWSALKGLFNGISQGTEVATDWQNFVSATIVGGDEMVVSLQGQFQAMSEAGFDYVRFLNSATAETRILHNELGGLDGEPLTRLSEAVEKVTGSTQKAAQITLQQVAAFAEMGLSVEDANKRIDEMIMAAEGGGGALLEAGESADLANESIKPLGESTELTAENASLAADEFERLNMIIRDLPEEVPIKVRVEGDPIPALASGGEASGLAIVNEAGPEIAKFPGGGMALMTAKGPVLGAFPDGTRIYSHSQSMAMMSRDPGIPKMQTGGTLSVSQEPTVINNYNLTANVRGGMVDSDTINQIFHEFQRKIGRRASA